VAFRGIALFFSFPKKSEGGDLAQPYLFSISLVLNLPSRIPRLTN